MRAWQVDLLEIASHKSESQHDLFLQVQEFASLLGFEYVAYGYQAPWPFNRQNITLVNNYPVSWQHRYFQAGYLEVDPTIALGRNSQTPIIWSDKLFAPAQSLWNEAREHGLRVGWAQSILCGSEAKGMLTLARSRTILGPEEILAKQLQLKWLAQVTHTAFAQIFYSRYTEDLPSLSNRELEVLKWSADGKSAQDIADILHVSKNTIDFHIKNVISKLQVPNKTAAVVRAAVLGML